MNQKQKTPLNYLKLIIICIAIAAYIYIAWRLVSFENWGAISSPFQFWHKKINLLFLLLITWLANLTSEVKKWQLLMRPYQALPFFSSVKQVLAGFVTAILSPGRVAEPGGRMLLLPLHLKEAALLTTSLGGFIQTIIITIAGLICLIYSHHEHHMFEQSQWSLIIYYFGLTILIVILLFVIRYYSSRLPYLKKLKGLVMQLKKLNYRLTVRIVGWTILRYFIYQIQLYLWLIFFGYTLPFEQFICLSPIYFYIITIIPSFLLTDLGIRGTVSLFVFSPNQDYEPLLIASIFCLWLLNVALPVLLGSLILINHKRRMHYSV